LTRRAKEEPDTAFASRDWRGAKNLRERDSSIFAALAAQDFSALR
jgi:hypothetical protein